VSLEEVAMPFGYHGNQPTASRAEGMRMAPGRRQWHLCWGTLIFKFFLISILSDLMVLMTT
jgi:hypothetical protein